MTTTSARIAVVATVAAIAGSAGLANAKVNGTIEHVVNGNAIEAHYGASSGGLLGLVACGATLKDAQGNQVGDVQKVANDNGGTLHKTITFDNLPDGKYTIRSICADLSGAQSKLEKTDTLIITTAPVATTPTTPVEPKVIVDPAPPTVEQAEADVPEAPTLATLLAKVLGTLFGS
ncbi:MAG: hypothetical protein LLG14_07760 [Nocardiaceae bacterium]|nr:hypothetical protein [Nocardiaceae bacterium]